MGTVAVTDSNTFYQAYAHCKYLQDEYIYVAQSEGTCICTWKAFQAVHVGLLEPLGIPLPMRKEVHQDGFHCCKFCYN